MVFWGRVSKLCVCGWVGMCARSHVWMDLLRLSKLTTGTLRLFCLRGPPFPNPQLYQAK